MITFSSHFRELGLQQKRFAITPQRPMMTDDEVHLLPSTAETSSVPIVTTTLLTGIYVRSATVHICTGWVARVRNGWHILRQNRRRNRDTTNVPIPIFPRLNGIIQA